jgi:hypothetical protein
VRILELGPALGRSRDMGSLTGALLELFVTKSKLPRRT